MTTKITKILKAWCVEVGEEITITQARREYLSLESPPERFTFYCNDPACRKLPELVSIVGANYRFPAQENKKYVAPYFRSKDEHHPDCQWLVQLDEKKPTSDEKPEEALQRMARRKVNDLITVFDPRSRATAAVITTQPGTIAGHGESAAGEGSIRGNTKNGDIAGENRTSDLDRLVDSYLEATQTLTHAEFEALRLKIIGRGNVSYRDYFHWVGRSDGSGVTYGGISKPESYGYGFDLIFFDKYQRRPVHLYVPSKLLRAYKHHRFLKSSVDEVLKSEGRKYLKVFCLGRFEFSSQHDSWNLVVDDLNHLVLRVISKEILDPSMI
ncbi:hypothetical protein [Acidovorax sp. SUPP2539]|uniref:hypothetical protein n=1 Tax=Acidovorax sp. SUPP2539 TaxID=2920878 RepID=UPI0023DE490E|nr:hypothetical protein [Acidovorax sp. SUPP2539]GKS92584.1 hypothetical protein AVTE2539_24485 [Acidovorax sp. SUPP2539]